MSTGNEKPTVLIVGAGLGGLTLGALLEKQGVPYTIFERASTIKAFGSAMSIGPTLLPLFEQLGIYDELVSLGKYLTHMTDYSETSQGLKPFPPMDMRPVEELSGYAYHILARPNLHALLLKLVPAHKIHFGHRVLNISEKDDKAILTLSNSETFEGDIIVGADGAYSAVRQRMYEQLKATGDLPISDYEELPFSVTCLVGQTRVLDPKDFPVVAQPDCHFATHHGKDKPFSWHTFNTSQGTLCWTVLHHLSKKSSKEAMEQRFMDTNNSEWGAHTAQDMCEETKGFPILLGGGKMGTMGDLFEKTPAELITKVMLEEKVFNAWYYRRFVLMGDACHKLNPAGGHGAMAAMHDAIAIANLIYAMPTKTSSDVTKVFEEYYKERHPAALESFNFSKQAGKRSEKSIIGAVMTYIMTHLPMWLWRMFLARPLSFRPQVGFLPAIALKGTLAPVVPPSEQNARAVFLKTQEHQQTEESAASV
ncbi:MAG: hypothetical protein J3R72DRAFT_529880 [Linnemannia gamsii]|nr:MAG: hypothetical protein J3R72DRAFT_529880 [Linnemannia gamsii]